MNSSLAVDPQPRYVFLTGGMNPGESSLILPFNNCEVFPRERTIRLELLEFELCSDNTHPHFSDSPKLPFPPADQPYQPVISVVRPAPLPATKRRRTNYYIPPTFKTGQWPYAATLDYPSGKRQKRKKKKKKQQPAPEEEEERGIFVFALHRRAGMCLLAVCVGGCWISMLLIRYAKKKDPRRLLQASSWPGFLG